VVFLDSSVLVTVPSDDWVTVFSFDLTVPSLLTLLVLVFETSRSHPISRNDAAKADAAAQITVVGFLILFLFLRLILFVSEHITPRRDLYVSGIPPRGVVRVSFGETSFTEHFRHHKNE
jgi:hypothetical protein